MSVKREAVPTEKELDVGFASLSLADSGRILVFCHGSVPRHGQARATAAFACVFPEHPRCNTAQRSEDERKNNRTYYLAVVEAMRLADEIDATGKRTLEIVSNSEVLTKTMTEWVDVWAKNKWRRSKNKPIENLDLVQKMYQGRQQRDSVVWTKVPNTIVEGLDENEVEKYHKQAIADAKAAASEP